MNAFKDKLKTKSWDKMAITKIEELEDKIRKSKKMLNLLNVGLNCDCIELSSCSKLV
jgi:hypothetical protein